MRAIALVRVASPHSLILKVLAVVVDSPAHFRKVGVLN
jgi:hypothetical protein